jgi:hypothetical protein
VRSIPPSQGEGQASSGTTVADEHMNIGLHQYVSHQIKGPSPTLTDISHLSQDTELLAINFDNRQASTSTVADEALPLGEHMNEVISVISKLEGLGLQRLQIPLPKCVVLGTLFLTA